MVGEHEICTLAELPSLLGVLAELYDRLEALLLLLLL